jgi:hypothetical protein
MTRATGTVITLLLIQVISCNKYAICQCKLDLLTLGEWTAELFSSAVAKLSQCYLEQPTFQFSNGVTNSAAKYKNIPLQ